MIWRGNDMKAALTGLRVIALSAVTLAVATNASAQQVNLADADPVAKGAAGERAGVYLDQGSLGGADSRKDLIIGAPGSAATPGTVYVLFGGPVPVGQFDLSARANVVVHGLTAGDQFGRSTAAGNVLNVEGTSLRNLVVGAPGAHGGRGSVYLFSAGFPTRTATAADAVLEIVGAPGDALGTALATADLNGDGHRDIVVGAAGTNRVYAVYWTPAMGGVRDLSVQPADLTMSGRAVGDVLVAGDLTGDGLGDIVIGSPTNNQVYFLAGRPGGGFAASINLATDSDAIFSGANGNDRAGAALAILNLDGDRNPDGTERFDLAIGAPGGDGPSESRTDSGEVYIIWGGAPIRSRSLTNADVTSYRTG